MASTKDTFVEKARAQLDSWKAQLDEWQAKANKEEAETRKEHAEEVADLRKKRDELEGKVKKAERSDGGTWEEIKGGVERSFNELKSSIEKARAKRK